MLEWEDGQVMDSSDGTVSITFKPFEIKTFKLLEKKYHEPEIDRFKRGRN